MSLIGRQWLPITTSICGTCRSMIASDHFLPRLTDWSFPTKFIYLPCSWAPVQKNFNIVLPMTVVSRPLENPFGPRVLPL
jgi:hypothetical protein